MKKNSSNKYLKSKLLFIVSNSFNYIRNYLVPIPYIENKKKIYFINETLEVCLSHFHEKKFQINCFDKKFLKFSITLFSHGILIYKLYFDFKKFFKLIYK